MKALKAGVEERPAIAHPNPQQPTRQAIRINTSDVFGVGAVWGVGEACHSCDWWCGLLEGRSARESLERAEDVSAWPGQGSPRKCRRPRCQLHSALRFLT